MLKIPDFSGIFFILLQILYNMNIKRLKKLALTLLLVLSFFTFSVFNVKAEELKYYLGGNVLGFNIDTEGVLVVGVNEVITEGGLISPCEKAGISVGDVFISLNDKVVNSPNDVACFMNSYDGGEIITKLIRNGKTKLVDITPVKDLTGEYRLGVYLRDGLNGLGTVTFYKSDGSFASLGHPVTDGNGTIYSVVGGEIYNSTIVGVNKAEKGKAGELKGMILNEKVVGNIEKNSNVGLYGKLDKFDSNDKIEVEIGKAKPGRAQIYSTVDGSKPKYYSIDIVRADYITGTTKNFVIKITDKELLKVTGGILQGMSGSPILQDGKLVGAVTHVFLNDSSRGYGIAIQNMI